MGVNLLTHEGPDSTNNCSEVGRFDEREIIVLLLTQILVCTYLIQDHGIMR